MEKTNARIIELIIKHLRQELSADEQEELNNWIDASERNHNLFQRCTDENMLLEGLEALEQVRTEDVWDNEKVWAKINQEKPASGVKRINVIRQRWLTVAACVLLLIAAGAYIWLKHFSENPPVAAINKTDILPGSNKAILQLANGAVIQLDSATKGPLAHQGYTQVTKVDSGELVYSPSSSKSGVMLYNKIITPRGGQYQVVLPDGSRVWLNAASSLRFPIAFNGQSRRVELTGEAYFEVARNTQMPFLVSVSSGERHAEIEVLGTHFDIMAYADEPVMKTTLLEGAVKISGNGTDALLQPGQQASLDESTTNIRLKKANIEEVIAWKEGLFHFDGDDLPSIMRKISRWYDVEVSYEENIPAGHFTGVISRDNNLSQVLKVLEFSGIHFTIEGKMIRVRK